jgi:hypothetical protein
MLPGRAIPRPQFERLLAGQPLSDFRVQRWQVNYDQAFARKAGERAAITREETDLASLLRCTACGGRVQRGGMAYCCRDCRAAYPIREGMVLLADHEGRGAP